MRRNRDQSTWAALKWLITRHKMASIISLAVLIIVFTITPAWDWLMWLNKASYEHFFLRWLMRIL